MPAIFAQHGLRQSAPAAKARPSEPVSRKVRREQASERMKALPPLWADHKLTGEAIAKILGFPTANSVYTAAWQLGLPRRPRAGKRRSNCNMTDEQIIAIITDAWPNSALTVFDIAKQCGWENGQSVTNWARKIGLPNRRTLVSPKGRRLKQRRAA